MPTFSVQQANSIMRDFFSTQLALQYPTLPIVGENTSAELPREHVFLDISYEPTYPLTLNLDPTPGKLLRDWYYSGLILSFYKVTPGTGGQKADQVCSYIAEFMRSKVLSGTIPALNYVYNITLQGSTPSRGMLVDGNRWWAKRVATKFGYWLQG